MTAPTLTRAEWLALRATGIGSSEAAAACGESSVSPAELVLRKRGVMLDPELSNQEAIDWGHLLQPVIVAKTAQRHGLRILTHGCVHKQCVEREIERTGETEVVGWLEDVEPVLRSVAHPFMTATIDGIAIDDDTGLIDIEAKNCGQYNSRDWDTEDGRAPPKFDVQLAHQLAVAPAFTAGLLAGLIGGNSLRVLRRERIEIQATIEAIITLETEVWRCVETGDLPAYDGSESHIRALRAMHPLDTGETIMLSEKALEWHQELHSLQIERTSRDIRIKQLRRNIESALNGATFGGLPDGSGVYTNKHQHTRSYTVEARDTPVLRFVKAANWDAGKQYREFDLEKPR
jgi:predicted phage-related endonuclease